MTLPQAASHRPPADFVLHEIGHGTNVEQPACLPTPDEHPRQGQHLFDAEAEHARKLELTPKLDEASQT